MSMSHTPGDGAARPLRFRALTAAAFTRRIDAALRTRTALGADGAGRAAR